MGSAEGGEALVSGLGSEIGSDVSSHLDGDSVNSDKGEFRIDIGADGPFQSTDDFLMGTAEQHVSRGLREVSDIAPRPRREYRRWHVPQHPSAP